MDNPVPGTPSRDELAERYFAQLPYDPYPVQEEALLAWFSSDQGVLVCAPTGTGKTLIAEAALFEALHAGKRAYYTTPLIALTEQKFREMQALSVQWGFSAADVGLVTGNRRENPDARILVVVAEILFNRLTHRETFDFDDVAAVVMDEFHSFNDWERGIVWEFSLGLLPPHVRLLLLSATVGNSLEFVRWLQQSHNRRIELVQSDQRKVPLIFRWVPDQLLVEHLEDMAEGDEEARFTPALVFCFNREQCWTVAEQIKGKKMLAGGQQAQLVEAVKPYDWSQGAGPKLKQLLLRGVGVHHAGVLPKYRRIVEELFQRKLLAIATCTETLSAGINLPARSVVLPSIIKGPPEKKVLLDPSGAHQIFGRAGRPQFDRQGYVFVLAHEDDVKIARWREEFDRIPADTKDPGLLRAKKRLKKKMPVRRSTEQYWNEAQFDKLRAAPPGKLASRGPLPWRLLAYMLEASPDVEIVRTLVGKRLMEPKRLQKAQEALDAMLITLWRAGYVTLEPEPPKGGLSQFSSTQGGLSQFSSDENGTVPLRSASGSARGGLSQSSSDENERKGDCPLASANEPGTVPVFVRRKGDCPPPVVPQPKKSKTQLLIEEALAAERGVEPMPQQPQGPPPYKAKLARPTPELAKLHLLRGLNPLYGVFLVNQLGIANRDERMQAFESVLELPRSIGHFVRVPRHDELPPGPLATTRLDEQLLRLGLVTSEQLTEATPEERDERRHSYDEPRAWVLTLAEKLRLMFDYDFPDVRDVRTTAVWAAGELLQFGDFNKYITSKQLQKQEGVIFRHLLRLILLLSEMALLCPPDTTEDEWRGDLRDMADRLASICRQVDPASTDKILEEAESAADLEAEA